MSNKVDESLVADIIEAIEKIFLYTAGMDKAAFMASNITVDAVSRNIMIIGEAASKLSNHYVNTHANVSFHDMKLLRNRFIHGYNWVSSSNVWQTVREQIPLWEKQITSCAHNNE